MEQQKKSLLRPYFVYFCVASANMLSFAATVTYNWSASIVPILKSNDTSINPLQKPPTTLESSWIVSIIMIGSIMGSLIGGVLIAKLGKKKAILLMGIPAFIGHLICAFATSVWAFLIARVTMGLTLGCSFGIMASYIGDIAEDKNRGLLGSATTVFMSMGGLSVYVIGPFVSIKLFSLLNLIPLILLFTVFGWFVPDTPFDLLQKNSIDEARKSLALYRGKSLTETDIEFKKLMNNVNSRNQNKAKKSMSTSKQLKTIFESESLIRGTKIFGAVLMLQGFTGMAAVSSYYQTIFDESSGSLESTYSVIVIGIVTLCSTIVTSQLVERLGRRLLLLIGFSLMGLSLCSLATYFLLKSKEYDIVPISWLPLASLMLFTLAFNVQGGIPWILLTDIFPPNVLDLCSTIGSIIMWTLYFVISLVFPYLKEILGNYGTFYIFGFCMACAVVFAFLCVPETKGKSVEEVQNLLTKKSKDNNRISLIRKG